MNRSLLPSSWDREEDEVSCPLLFYLVPLSSIAKIKRVARRDVLKATVALLLAAMVFPKIVFQESPYF